MLNFVVFVNTLICGVYNFNVYTVYSERGMYEPGALASLYVCILQV